MAKQEEARKDNSQPTYTLDEICANSETVFGVKREIVVGALYGSVKERFSVAEVRELIGAFRKRRVK